MIVRLACVGLLLSGCATVKQSVPVPTQSSTSIAVHVGERVEIQTTDGRTLEFVVTQIEPTALVGDYDRVEFADIAGLQVVRVDGARTATNVAVGIGLIGVAVAVIGISENGVGLGP